MTRPGTVFIQLEEDECAPDRWTIVFRNPRNNEVIGVPVRGLPYEVALSHVKSLGFAFEYGAEYATDVIRHEALLGWSVEPGAEPVAAPDERIVSYILPGIDLPTQHVIESRERVALKDDDCPWWRLKRKSRQAKARPLSDWEYEELIPTSRAVTSEATAVLWVAGDV